MVFFLSAYESYISDIFSFVLVRNTTFADIVFVRWNAVEALEQYGCRKGFKGIQVNKQ